MSKNQNPETAFAIGIIQPKQKKYEALESFSELKSLLTTAGANLMEEGFLEVRQINPATYIGHGKVEEYACKFFIQKPDVVIVDAELSPVQNRNLEEAWKTRVLDRTGLILDIFAQRARSREGQLQVELAQYQYLLPRLVRAWTHLSKQRGGAIGLRGPGETQLEVDRRRIREKIDFLKRSLDRVSSSRENHRKKRQSVPMPTVSLIGYTNTGKSTLFNALVGGSSQAEDKLFATLDPKTKRWRLPSGQVVLLSDTVGFIRNLPHQLVESFKSTFEEVAESDLLIHVIDSSHPDRAQQVATVEQVLADLELGDIPVLRVMNKLDQITDDSSDLIDDGDVIGISALTGAGLEDLADAVGQTLARIYYRRMRLLVPYTEGRVLSDLYAHGRVLATSDTPDGSLVDVELPPKWSNIYGVYSVSTEAGSMITESAAAP